jgi:hypothetical protein
MLRSGDAKYTRFECRMLEFIVSRIGGQLLFSVTCQADVLRRAALKY